MTESVAQTSSATGRHFLWRMTFSVSCAQQQGVLDALPSHAQMAPAEKLRRVRQSTLAVNRLSLAGRRLRDPQLGRAEPLRQLARQRLGPEVFARIYEDEPEPDGTGRAS